MTDEGAPVLGLRVRVFNWRLRAARERKGWSQAELSRRSGVTHTTVNAIEGLRRAPTEAQADALCIALETPIDEVFPGVLDGLLAERSYLDISLGEADVRLLTTGGGVSLHRLLPRAVGAALEDLTPKERAVVVHRFGLLDGHEATLEQVARRVGLESRERARQFEAKALNKLRHPRRARHLAPFLDDPEDDGR